MTQETAKSESGEKGILYTAKVTIDGNTFTDTQFVPDKAVGGSAHSYLWVILIVVAVVLIDTILIGFAIAKSRRRYH